MHQDEFYIRILKTVLKAHFPAGRYAVLHDDKEDLSPGTVSLRQERWESAFYPTITMWRVCTEGTDDEQLANDIADACIAMIKTLSRDNSGPIVTEFWQKVETARTPVEDPSQTEMNEELLSQLLTAGASCHRIKRSIKLGARCDWNGYSWIIAQLRETADFLENMFSIQTESEDGSDS